MESAQGRTALHRSPRSRQLHPRKRRTACSEQTLRDRTAWEQKGEGKPQGSATAAAASAQIHARRLFRKDGTFTTGRARPSVQGEPEAPPGALLCVGLCCRQLPASPPSSTAVWALTPGH